MPQNPSGGGSSIMDQDAFRSLCQQLQAPVIYARKAPESEPIAQGHYAMVYKGEAMSEGRNIPVAIKVFRNRTNTAGQVQTTDKLVVREINTWHRLRHRHILPFLGAHPDPFTRRIWLVSPWIERGSLWGLLEQDYQMDCISMCRGIVRGVKYLHDQEVLHGDIRTTNVLIDPDGEPLLADFGLSRLMADLAVGNYSSSGLYRGSLRWMAPERHEPEKFGLTAVGAQKPPSDVYSVGMTMYEIFTRQQPFPGRSDFDVVRDITSGRQMEHPGELAESRGMNARRWDFMRATWDKDRDRRPLLIDALRTILWTPAPAPSRSQTRGIAVLPYTRALGAWIEIDVKAGDILYELENWSEGWTLGMKSDGEKGIFPASILQTTGGPTSHGAYPNQRSSNRLTLARPGPANSTVRQAGTSQSPYAAVHRPNNQAVESATTAGRSLPDPGTQVGTFLESTVSLVTPPEEMDDPYSTARDGRVTTNYNRTTRAAYPPSAFNGQHRDVRDSAQPRYRHSGTGDEDEADDTEQDRHPTSRPPHGLRRQPQTQGNSTTFGPIVQFPPAAGVSGQYVERASSHFVQSRQTGPPATATIMKPLVREIYVGEGTRWNEVPRGVYSSSQSNVNAAYMGSASNVGQTPQRSHSLPGAALNIPALKPPPDLLTPPSLDEAPVSQTYAPPFDTSQRRCDAPTTGHPYSVEYSTVGKGRLHTRPPDHCSGQDARAYRPMPEAVVMPLPQVSTARGGEMIGASEQWEGQPRSTVRGRPSNFIDAGSTVHLPTQSGALPIRPLPRRRSRQRRYTADGSTQSPITGNDGPGEVVSAWLGSMQLEDSGQGAAAAEYWDPQQQWLR